MNEDKSTRYQRLKRQAGIVSLFWGVVLLAGLVASGAHVALRDAAESAVPATLGSWRSTAIVFAFVAALSIANEIVMLPLGFYSGFILERRYDLSNETLPGWLRDQAKSFILGVVLGGAAAAAIYWCIRRSPESWWVSAGVLFTVLIVGLTNVAPVLLLPIFYTVKPLDRDALRTRLLALAGRAGARVLGAYEWASAARRGRPMPRSPGLVPRAASWSPTPCWPNTRTTRSR